MNLYFLIIFAFVMVEGLSAESTTKLPPPPKDFIREQNEKYERGESSFYLEDYDETLQRTGERFSPATGLIMPENYENIIDEESERYFAKFEENRQTYPAFYNSTAYGYITPVKNQKQCGSCGAFATVGSVEACMIKAGGYASDLSEQNIMDCAYNGDTANGCEGAWPHVYIQYIRSRNGGEMVSEASDPYLARLKSCSNRGVYKTGARVVGSYFKLRGATVNMIKGAIMENGAVVSGVVSKTNSFRYYRGGILDNICNQDYLDHAIVIVGWGKSGNTDYWIAKNSWDTNWGEQGYFRIKFGTCKIGDMITTTVCQRTGQTPTTTTTTTTGSTNYSYMWCNISRIYNNANINGYYSVGANGYQVNAMCRNSWCYLYPINYNVNACKKICGKYSCP